MPWKISERDGKYCVVKATTDEELKCYDNKADALAYLRALYMHAADELANETTVEQIRMSLNELTRRDPRLNAAPPSNGEMALAYVVDIVVSESSGGLNAAIVVCPDGKYRKVGFTLADDGTVSLSLDEPVVVEQKSEWKDVKPPAAGNAAEDHEPGFFRYCMQKITPEVDVEDKEAFCAWLHEKALGYWPAEAKNDLVEPDAKLNEFVAGIGGQQALTIAASAFLPSVSQPCAGCANELDIELCTICNEAFQASNEWIQLSPYGEFPHKLGVQCFKKPEAESIVKSWESLGNVGVRLVGMPIYLGHPDHPDFERRYFDTRAYGRIKKLEARDDGLYAQVKWNKLGKEAIDNEMFHGVSVNWLVNKGPDGKLHPKALKSVGLTNEPNIPVRPPTISEP